MQSVTYSKRTVASYVFDWFLVVVFALITYGLNKVTPVYHPFSLLDLTISYPFTEEELVPTSYLVLAAIAIPLIIILVLSVLLVFIKFRAQRMSIQKMGARMLWEANAGLLGLALSVLVALLLTTGMKNVFGRPRPDLLSRCNPDPAAVREHMVGGFQGNGISPGWVLVDESICRQSNQAILNDGFRSFPSGHSSTAWSGLLYFALYLCTKFGMAFPFLTQFSRSRRPEPSGYGAQANYPGSSFEAERKPILDGSQPLSQSYHGRRDEGAAPPLYLHFLLFVPIGTAIFICASRWFDYRHHAFDILSGSFIGIISAWYAFNMYQMPIGRGAGWSWGPRGAKHSFVMGVGSESWGSAEDELQSAAKRNDVEMGSLARSDPVGPGTSTLPAMQPYETFPVQGR